MGELPEVGESAGRVPADAPAHVKLQPVLCTDDHVRVAVCPLVTADGDALKKVITARGVTVTAMDCWVGLVPAAPAHIKV